MCLDIYRCKEGASEASSLLIIIYIIYIHINTARIEVPFMWGSLRLAPINLYGLRTAVPFMWGSLRLAPIIIYC